MPTGPLRLIMLDAWQRAREAAATHGGTARQYMPECLKQAWALKLADRTTQRIMKQERQSRQYWKDMKAQAARMAAMPRVTPAYIASGYGRGGDRHIISTFGR